jgi:hypothetical protein
MNLNLSNTDLEPTVATEIRHFFDKTYTTDVSFPSQEIDAVVAFFQKRNFDTKNANLIAIVLLNQAKVDGVDVFTIIDTLKKTPTLQLNQFVAEVLNTYRSPTSKLGYRVNVNDNVFESRNILV